MNVFLALLPLLATLVGMFLLRPVRYKAGLLALIVTASLALFVPAFQFSLRSAFHALSLGALLGMGAILVLFPALLLFQIQKISGALNCAVDMVCWFIPDPLLQLLFVLFGYGIWVEAFCGPGIGLILLLPLLLGVEKASDSRTRLTLALLSLLGQALILWENSGTFEILLFTLPACGLPLLALFLRGGMAALRRFAWVALATGLLLMLGESLGSRFTTQSASSGLGGTLVMVFLVVFAWIQARRPFRKLGSALFRSLPLLLRIGAPLLLLCSGMLASQALPAIRNWTLFQDTGYALTPLAGPGCWLLVASAVATGCFPQVLRATRRIWQATWRATGELLLVWSSFLAVLAIMQATGMLTTLQLALIELSAKHPLAILFPTLLDSWWNGLLPPGVNTGGMFSALLVGQGHAGLWLLAGRQILNTLLLSAAPLSVFFAATLIGARDLAGHLFQRAWLAIGWISALVCLLLLWLAFKQTALSLLLPLVALAPILPSLFTRKQRRSLQPSLSQMATGQHTAVPRPEPWVRQRLFASPLFMRLLAYGAFVVVYLLYGSYSMVASEPLSRVDPVVFTFLQTWFLLPLTATAGIHCWRKQMISPKQVTHSLLSGACLGIGFLCISIALKNEGITQTTVLACLDGIVATLVMVFILRQRVSFFTWLACGCLALGAICVGLANMQDWQSGFIAFAGGSMFTLYSFLVEHQLGQRSSSGHALQTIIGGFGIQFLAIAVISAVVAVGFGKWNTLQTLHPSDVLTLAYLSVGTTLVPVIIATVMQRWISAVTVSFLAILEPLSSSIFAYFMGERMPHMTYLGAGIVFIGVLLQAWANAREQTRAARASQPASPPTAAPGQKDAEPETSFPSAQLPTKHTSAPVQGKRSRAILAYLTSAPQGARSRELQQIMGWTYRQTETALRELQRKGYIIPCANDRHRYTLNPQKPLTGKLLWSAS